MFDRVALSRSSPRIPWCVPAWGVGEFRATVAAVLGGRIVEGAAPARAAEAVRALLGVRYALPVNCGRTALELGMRALGVGPGSDVVLPSYICRTVLSAVESTGADPVFADVGEDLNVTPETVRCALTSRTRCVIVPHLFGKAAPIDQIEAMLRGRGVALIDDAAQAWGARCSGRLAGTFGDLGVVSCGLGKPLAGAAGGLLVTNSRAIYEGARGVPLGRERAMAVIHRTLSFWVWRRFRRQTRPLRIALNRLIEPRPEPPHSSCAMSNLDGAILLEQVRKCRMTSRRRRHHASILAPTFRGEGLGVLDNAAEDDVAIKLVLILPAGGPCAADVIARLEGAGIEASRGYTPLHLERPATTNRPLLVTESFRDRVVWIPLEDRAGVGLIRTLRSLGLSRGGAPRIAETRPPGRPGGAVAEEAEKAAE